MYLGFRYILRVFGCCCIKMHLYYSIFGNENLPSYMADKMRNGLVDSKPSKAVWVIMGSKTFATLPVVSVLQFETANYKSRATTTLVSDKTKTLLS